MLTGEIQLKIWRRFEHFFKMFLLERETERQSTSQEEEHRERGRERECQAGSKLST